VPFTGSASPGEAWYASFLSDLAIKGGISLAAAAAGVHRGLVYRRISDDPAFAEEVEVAKAYYRDLLEWESVDLARRKDNPLPYFARLKAELPARYIDRQAVLLASAEGLPAEDGAALLAAMLGSALGSTRQSFADPQALTELGSTPAAGPALPAE
jgi:AcrR family transcriptional regulator